MANISSTYSGDFSSFMVGKLFDIISDARTNRASAERMAARYGVDPQLRRGEFLGRSIRDDVIRNTLGNRFVPRTNTRDLISRGQSTPFASPLASDYFNRGQSSPLPMAVQKAARAGQPFPNIAVGAPLSAQVKPQTSAVPSASRPVQSTKADKPVKVKDEKLGVYLAAVIKALNASVASINERLDDTEQGVIEAKEGVFGTIKQLEQNSDLLESKLDSIIDALRQQNALAKVQEDTSEVQRREDETEKEYDLADTERIIKPDEKKGETIQLNLLDDIKESQEKRDEQLSLPFVGGDEGFEKGGIVSGPDSGYFAKLHGDEMIIPLDNNYTQGEPSAVDGKIARRPQKMQSFEKGTPNVENLQTPMNMGINIFNKAASVEGELPDIKEDVEKLTEAMLFPIRSTGILISHLTQDALGEMGSLAGAVGQEISQVAKAFGSKFDVPVSISNSLVRQKKAEKKTEERQKKTQEFRTQSNNAREWWDPFGVFTGGEGGGRRYGTGGPGLSYGGVRAGFTGMGPQGFNAISGGSPFQLPQSSLFGRGSRPLLGRGAYVAPTARGASRYVKPGGGIIRSITPAGATGNLFVDMIEPQRVVNPKTFDKGKALADKILSNQPMTRAGGSGGTSVLRQRLAQQLTSGQGTQVMSNVSGLGRGAAFMRVLAPVARLAGKLSKIPLLADMLFPDPTAQYDQVTGPNAMYNDPKLSPEQRSMIYQSIHGPGSAGQGASMLNQASQDQAVNRFARQTVTPSPIFINNQTVEDGSSDIPQSFISNMGDPGFSALYPSLR